MRALLLVAAWGLLGGTSCWAQVQPGPAAPADRFVRQGDTVFVSGRLAHWFGRLLAQFPHPDDAQALHEDALHPQRRVRHIVFVNALGRPERSLGVDLLAPRLAGRELQTTVIGRCDLFCARLFVLGTQRGFGPDLPGQPTWIDVRPPVDLETRQWVNRQPERQIALLTRQRPELAVVAARWERAMRRTLDASGGLRLYLDQPALFCPGAARPCELQADMTARAIGLVNLPDRVPVKLPAELAVAAPDAPWPPFFDTE